MQKFEEIFRRFGLDYEETMRCYQENSKKILFKL